MPRSRRPGWSAWATACALTWTLASAAHAQQAIDNHRGPLLSSSRITGLGGAYTAVAEGVDGYFRNPASMANRNALSTAFFSPGLALDLQATTSDAVDFDNDGRSDGGRATNLLAGVRLGLGPFATGLVYNRREYAVGTTQELAGSAALSIVEGTLIVGLGAGARWIGLTDVSDGDAQGWFFDAGLLLRPVRNNYRIGLRGRAPSTLRVDSVAGGNVAVRFPAEANVGFAYMVPFGDRTWNEPIGGWEGWGVRRSYLDNRYVLFSVDLVADSRVDEASNPESLRCTVLDCGRRSGDKLSFGFNAGIESEIIDNRLRIRVGTYSEADRTQNEMFARFHFTGGADLRLFDLAFLPLKIGAAFDLAARYTNVQLSLGFWT